MVAVRVMDPDELSQVRAVATQAFGDEHIGELIDALRASPGWEDRSSFVAEVDGEIVGQALYTRARLDAPSRLVPVLVLSPIGVLPAHQGTGVATALLTESLRALEERSEPLVFLEGDPSFYGRVGFAAARERGFRSPSLRIPPPAFQVRTLAAFEPWMTGTFVYPDVFWDHDAVGLRA